MLFHLLKVGIGFILIISGMNLISYSLKCLVEKGIKQYAEILSDCLFLGISIGIVSTTLVQSSSIVTLIVVALVNSGVINFRQSAGIIIGSNIGTTITTHIVSLNKISLILFFFLTGILFYFKKNNHLKKISKAFFGVSFLFSSLIFLESNVSLNYSEKIIPIIKILCTNPLLSIIAGFILTTILQSSSLTSIFLVLIARQSHIDLVTAVYMLLGINMGTCTTSLIASFWAINDGKKTALFHLCFNVIGAILIIWIFPVYINIISFISPDEIGKQIANAHTLFNVLSAIFVLPFLDIVLNFINKLLPD